jgi:hypothetical protein
MPISDNPFIGFSDEDIAELKSAYKQVLLDIAKAGQSYAFPGRSFTRADIPNVLNLLSQLRAAADVASGAAGGRQFVQARVNTTSRFIG